MTVARQAPLSMGFSRQEYWNGLPFPSPEALPNPGIEPRSPALQADSLLSKLLGRCYLLEWLRSKKKKVLARIWGNWNIRALLMGILNGTAAMENGMEVLQKK